MFLKILRKLLFIPQPLISKNEALQIAYRLVVRIMLSMDDPHIHEGLREWIIWLTPHHKPSSMMIIDQQSGKIKKINIPLP